MANAVSMEKNGHVIFANTKQYLLTSLADVAKLPKNNIQGTLDTNLDAAINEPCAYGSTAIVKDGGAITTLMLFPDNEWTTL